MKELSMSALETFQRCRRKFYYRYVLGLIPKETPEYMAIGSAFHAGVAGGYREYASRKHFVEIAQQAFREWLNTDDARGFNPDDRGLVEDMIKYWWEHEGITQDYSEIVSVEEHLPYQIPGTDRYIRCTPDLLARRSDSGRLVLTDHKTVGGVNEALAFLPLDFQLRLYTLQTWRRYGELPEIDYNMVRRELPPDFMRADGQMPYALTPTGKPSKRSADPKDYIRRERQTFTEKQLLTFEKQLLAIVNDVDGEDDYTRTVIKNGATACSGCKYLTQCTRELDGGKLDGITLKWEFDHDPDVLEVAA